MMLSVHLTVSALLIVSLQLTKTSANDVLDAHNQIGGQDSLDNESSLAKSEYCNISRCQN